MNKVSVNVKKRKIENTVLAILSIILLAVLFSAGILLSTAGIKVFTTNYLNAIGYFLFVLFVFMVYFLYQIFYRKTSGSLFNELVISYVIIVISSAISVLLSYYLHPFLIVLASAPLICGILISKRVGMVINAMSSIIVLISFVVIGIITGVAITPSQVYAVILSMLTGIVMIYIINKNYSRYKLSIGGFLVSVCMFPVSFLLSVAYETNLLKALTNSLMLLAGNLFSVTLFVAFLPILEVVFKVWTNFKYSELSSFNQPLLKRLSAEAPGTFNHSLIVGNLAESCALAIGENSYIARVAGYYHDVGKIKNPEFFVENQKEGYNPHNDLIPEVSVNIIKKHTIDGYEMLKEAGLPKIICNMALEHHGKSQIQFFYLKAKNITEGEINSQAYMYDNPLPQNKIAAILMIADTVEAASRAKGLQDKTDLQNFIDSIVKHKLDTHQFDDCDITMKDLKIIKSTIVEVLPAIYHKRIDYPTEKKND